MADSVVVQGLIELSSEEVALLLESGLLLMEMRKFKEAEEVFEGVAALIPHSEVPLVFLGNLHFSQGRYERALKMQREALKRSPTSALAQAHVGEALMFLKRRDEAKAALEGAIAMDPDGDAASFARSLLDAAAAEVV